MQMLAIYHCLGDATRLRILNLLMDGPLCVCHLAAILRIDQPKISRHLKVLKAGRAVATTRCRNWTVYRLADAPAPLMDVNLRSLQDCRAGERVLATDLRRRAHVLRGLLTADCRGVPEVVRGMATGTVPPLARGTARRTL
jgi:ArsR family transcriptional regulator, arsenate/arsenite/antimonite-responsive transcriptional repressor